MRIQGKALAQVRWSDLEALIDGQIAESPTLDYKQELPEPSDAGKREFLKDASALANASGGTLLYGIEEGRDENGAHSSLPVDIPGCDAARKAMIATWLEQVLRSGLDPRLGQFAVQLIEDPSGTRYVVAVGVPSSLLSPHAVAFKTKLPFYRRIGTARHDMTTDDLRQQFLERGDWLEQSQALRRSRLDLFRSDRASVPFQNLERQAALLLHILPLGRLDQWLDLSGRAKDLYRVFSTNQQVWKTTFNFDGLLCYDGYSNPLEHYVQWFRSGGLEVFGSCKRSSPNPPNLCLEATWASIQAVEWSLMAMRAMSDHLQLEPPFSLSLSVLNAHGLPIDVIPDLLRKWGHRGRLPGQPIDEDLCLPEVFFEEVPSSDAPDLVAEKLRLHLDALWQAGGWERCPLYDAHGAWTGRDIVGWQSVL